MVRLIFFTLILTSGIDLLGQSQGPTNHPSPYYINLEKAAWFNLPTELTTAQKSYVPAESGIINVNVLEKFQSDRIETPLFEKKILEILKVLFQNKDSLIHDDAEVFYMGSYQFKPLVNTELFVIDIKDKEYWLRTVLGLNEVDGRIVSAMKIAYSVRIIGFSSVVYSHFDRGVFKMLSLVASDVVGRNNRPTVVEKIKIRKNGTLR